MVNYKLSDRLQMLPGIRDQSFSRRMVTLDLAEHFNRRV